MNALDKGNVGNAKTDGWDKVYILLNLFKFYIVDPHASTSRFRTSVLWEIRFIFGSYFYLIMLLTWRIVLFAYHDILRAFMQKFCHIC
jgi:hypothetical protein